MNPTDQDSLEVHDSAPDLFPKWTVGLVIALIGLIAASIGYYRLNATKPLEQGELVLVWPRGEGTVVEGRGIIIHPAQGSARPKRVENLEFKLSGPVTAVFEEKKGWGWWRTWRVQFTEQGCWAEVSAKDVKVARYADVEAAGSKAKKDERRTDHAE